MKRAIALAALALALVGPQTAFAQDDRVGPGRLEITLIPVGTTFFTEKSADPSFGNYDVGGSVAYNVNRVVGIEGEIGGTLGISQTLQFGGRNGSIKTPNMANYSANLVLSAPTQMAVVPYVTGGVGGVTIFETVSLGIPDVKTLFASNVGGGLKWYANGRWALRADYRFIVTQSKDDAPAFFGREMRYGHRIYGAVVVNAIR
jgi:opacity protein-like surface antigen